MCIHTLKGLDFSMMKLFFSAKKYSKFWTQNELVNGICNLEKHKFVLFFGTEKGLSII